MQLIVPDDKLSLAIGKKGQNVRLASQLTGWRIDIHSESKVREMEERAHASLAAIPGVTSELAETLFRGDWRSAAEVARTSEAELAAVPGIGSAEAAARIIAAAAIAAEVEKAHLQAERDAATAAAATAAADAASAQPAEEAPHVEGQA
jgi:N utilization substance protein A